MKKRELKLGAALAAVAIAVSVAGCAKKDAAADKQVQSAQAQQAAYGTWGVDTTQGDPSVRPGDDFARYANGKWLDTFEIPSDLPGYVSFTKLRLDAEADVKAIIEELASNKSANGSLEQKVGDYFKTWMDEGAANAAGAAPLKSHLDAIYAIADQDAMTRALASVHMNGPAGFGVIPDPADTTKYMAFVGQAGIGLPDRDYYLKSDGKFPAYRDAYKAYIAKLFDLAGIEGGASKADAILAFETKIAEAHWTQEDSRNIQKIYNPMSAEEIEALAPEFNWAVAFDELGLSSVPTFLVAQPSALDTEAELFAAADMAFLKDWLAFHFISNHAEYLSSDFDNAKWEFYTKTLRGVEEKRERWKRGVNQIDASLGDAVGQIYVQKHFPPASKAAMDGLVKNLTAAFEERLRQNDWMDEETREQALLKLSTFEPRIGYPTKYTDYSSLEISNASLFDNALALADFAWRDQIANLGKPVDRERWGYPPQTVNASYNPLLNQITFPAGILQPPFFDPAADAAVNYGAIGAVIGHEIGHGFDDQGREFDEKGRIRNWWSEASNEAFTAKTAKLGAQYDAYEPLPGAHVSGELTMGENIGDLGGLQMAYAAYHRYLDQTSGGEAPVIDGLTGDQRFFLAWAQVWQGKYRDDEVLQRLETDPHSPPYFRINGPVRNLDAWYEAFGVTAEDDLYLPPEDRVRIW
ncbi:MAG: M13 family metallopeptidase [Parvularculaceae bacterium]